MVLAIAEGLTMDNDLVLGVYEGLAIISLDDTVGSHDGGRVIVRNITLFFSASRTLFGLVFGEPFFNQLCLLLQLLHQLPSAAPEALGRGGSACPRSVCICSSSCATLASIFCFFFLAREKCR